MIASDPLFWKHIRLRVSVPLLLRIDQRNYPFLKNCLQSAVSVRLDQAIFPCVGSPTPSIFCWISRSPRLTTLIVNCDILDGRAELGECFKNSRSSLRHVRLSRCRNVGLPTVFPLVKHHPDLLSLDLSQSRVSDEGLLLLYKLTHLTDLSLECSFGFTPGGLSAFLKKYFPLRVSRLNFCNVPLPAEWLLNLDASVKLVRLDVTNIGVITTRDVQKFRERWGDCEILH
jgi:hypothetical protein